MLLLHCNAIVSSEGDKEQLLRQLLHCDTPFTDAGDRVTVDTECDTVHEAMQIIGAFESVESKERGFSIIGGRKEASYDSG